MLALLGFDTASAPRLQRLLEAGQLPALAELMQRGRWYRLDRPAKDVEAGAYQTLYSGTGLNQHGLYYPFQWSPAEQRLRYIHKLGGPKSLWERLACAERPAFVVDPYEARTPRTTAGVYLSGWQFTNRFVLPRWSSPAPLHPGLGNRFGAPPMVEEVFGRTEPAALRRLRTRLLRAPQRVADAVTHLLPRGSFQLLWANFCAAHVAGHCLWESSGPIGDGLTEIEGCVDEVYCAVDDAISQILGALPPDADVIVFSASGMAPNTSRVDLLPEMLHAVLSGTRAGGKHRAGSIWRLRAAVPASLRGAVARALPRRVLLELAARLELRGVDWARTRAFALPSDDTGYVRFNVRDRERDGIVGPDETDALAQEIADGLMTFRDPDGSRSVEAVERVSSVVEHGPGIDRLPDLVVRWGARPTVGLSGVASSRFGDVQRRGEGTGRTGNHTADAWALVVPQASSLRELPRPPHIVDLAMTTCSLLGADTSGLAGEPLLEAA